MHQPVALGTITLRLARVGDERSLERLAALYDRQPLAGPVLLAFVEDELQAALTLAGDRELMEPYLPTAGLVDLLALLAKQLREDSGPRKYAEQISVREAALNRFRPNVHGVTT